MHEPVDPPPPAPFDARSWIGHPVTGVDGSPLGLLAGVHADRETGLPAWAAVDDGAGGIALVPLRDARHDPTGLRVPYTVAQLATAPHPGHAGPPGPGDLDALHRHYALGPPVAPAAGPVPSAPAAGPVPSAPAAGPVPSAPVAPPAPAATGGAPAVTRYEERLRVGAQTVVTGRVRVRKRLVTEQRTITVPVTREEITVEHLDVPAGPAGPGGGTGTGPLSDEVLDLVLYEERPVVTTEIVPVERVRVVRHVVTAPEVVGGTVRREVVEVDDDVRGGPLQ